MQGDTNMTQRTTHNQLIGQKNQEYYCLDTTFKHDDGMEGATGTILRAVTEDEHESRMQKWNEPTEYHPMYHIWKQEVENEETMKSFKEWLGRIEQWKKEEIEYDSSGAAELHEKIREKFKEETGEDVYIVECIGGGRCVDKPASWYDKVFNQEALEKVKEVEEVNE